MRTDFCWCAAHFNSTVEFGSSTWEPIEMQKEARSIGGSFYLHSVWKKRKYKEKLTNELPIEPELEIGGWGWVVEFNH